MYANLPQRITQTSVVFTKPEYKGVRMEYSLLFSDSELGDLVTNVDITTVGYWSRRNGREVCSGQTFATAIRCDYNELIGDPKNLAFRQVDTWKRPGNTEETSNVQICSLDQGHTKMVFAVCGYFIYIGVDPQGEESPYTINEVLIEFEDGSDIDFDKPTIKTWENPFPSIHRGYEVL